MKKPAILLLSSLLVLGGCDQKEESKEKTETKEKSDEKVNTNKVQFKNDTVVIEDGYYTIKEVFILNDKDTNKKNIVFKILATNKTDKNISPSTLFMATTSIFQDDENTETKLDPSISANEDDYKEWKEHTHDNIKKGKEAKGIMTYELKSKNDVIVKFRQGISGKNLGEKKYKLSDLKEVDYSMKQ
nr:DUF5067 domain-containing protein [Mammaliicoccus sp. Marseille-Q6498]